MSAPHARSTRTTRRRRGRRPSPTGVIVGVVAGLAVIAVLLTLSGGEDAGAQSAPVSITGATLPREGAPTDPAIGMRAPGVRGTDFDGTPVAIAVHGRATAIMFVAHWCPHCQREVPKVVSWMRDSGGVDGVDVVAVSSMASPKRPNWPPSAWLEREGWTWPVLRDDLNDSAAHAFGLTGTPMWVFVRPDGTVARRLSGEVPIEVLEAQMRASLTR